MQDGTLSSDSQHASIYLKLFSETVYVSRKVESLASTPTSYFLDNV